MKKNLGLIALMTATVGLTSCGKSDKNSVKSYSAEEVSQMREDVQDAEDDMTAASVRFSDATSVNLVDRGASKTAVMYSASIEGVDLSQNLTALLEGESAAKLRNAMRTMDAFSAAAEKYFAADSLYSCTLITKSLDNEGKKSTSYAGLFTYHEVKKDKAEDASADSNKKDDETASAAASTSESTAPTAPTEEDVKAAGELCAHMAAVETLKIQVESAVDKAEKDAAAAAEAAKKAEEAAKKAAEEAAKKAAAEAAPASSEESAS